MPLEVFACFKAASLTEEGGGLLAKNTKHVEEIKFHDQATLRDLFLEFGNKYQRCLKQDEIMCKRLEIMRFTARYGHYNRLGVPQFTL